LFPALIHAQKTSMVEYERRLRNLYVLVGGMAVSIAGVIFFVAPVVVNLIYGSEYSSVVSTLRIYIWSGIPVFLMVVMSQYLLAENYTKIYVAVTIVGAVANIFLNLVWIPRYGINGSAIATLVSYSTVPFVLLFFKKTRDHIVSMGKGG
jgi:O-antigen/teichoic acid export membrane protein